MHIDHPHLPESGSDLLEFLRLLKNETAKAIEQVNKGIERLERLELCYDTLIDLAAKSTPRPFLPHGTGDPSPKTQRAPWLQLSPRELQKLKDSASAGFTSMQLEPQEDGYGRLRVGDSDSFILTPKLAGLVRVLLEAPEAVPGKTLPWQAFQQVATLLGIVPGSGNAGQTLSMRIHRLRLKFWEHGVNPFFVETRTGLGVRLAWRLPPLDVIGGDLT
jgi:hypothetical protein